MPMLEVATSSIRSLGDVTYETLLGAVLSGHLRVGEHLTERALASEMGVSTTPVKEALRRLENEGLVSRVPRKGYYVSAASLSLIREMGFVRAVLEGVAASLAAQRLTDAYAYKLRGQIEIMAAVTDAQSPEGMSEANAQFHQLVCGIAGSAYIQRLLVPLRSFDRGIRNRALVDMSEARRGFLEHKAIAEAIVSRKAEEAESEMRKHILRTLDSIVQKAQRQEPSCHRADDRVEGV